MSSGTPTVGREVAADGFGVVVEVDEHGLVEAGLDEAVGVTVEGGVQRLAGQEPLDVLDEDLAFEVGDRPGLRGGQVGGVADGEDVRRGLGLQRVRVGHDEVEGVAQAGGVGDVGRAAVHGDDDGEIEGDLAPVEADEPSTGRRRPRRC